MKALCVEEPQLGCISSVEKITISLWVAIQPAKPAKSRPEYIGAGEHPCFIHTFSPSFSYLSLSKFHYDNIHSGVYVHHDFNALLSTVCYIMLNRYMGINENFPHLPILKEYIIIGSFFYHYILLFCFAYVSVITNST